MTITKKVVFVAKVDKVAELKALLQTMVEASRREPGCEFYNIYQVKSQPETFVVIETWKDEEALKRHQQSPHYLYYKHNFIPYTADKYSDELVSLG